MDVDKKIIRTSVNMEPHTILTENQIKFVLSKNNKLSAVMNNLNKAKVDSDGSSSLSASSSVPVNELGKMLLNYSKEGNAEKILKLIQEGAPFISDWLGMSALHFSAMNNHREVLELLLKSGLNKDTRTKVDRSALHLAAYHGHEEIVEVLLKVDCDVNARDMLRMTPLHWAVERRHTEVSKLLLKYGADVDAVSKFGKTPLSIAIQTGQTELLKDLQNARDNMRSKPEITDQTQNETNAAVNSIMLDNNEEDIFDIDEEGDIKIKALKADTEDIDSTTEEYQDNMSTIDMLKKLKSMMAVEDADDTLLTSALQNGRQLVLTEGGKLALNHTKHKQVSIVPNESFRKQISDEDKYKRTFSIKPKSVPLKPSGKNVKILSMDAFKKMYGQNALNTIQNQNIINSGLTKSNIKPGMHLTKLTRVTNLAEINGKKTIYNPTVPSNSSNIISTNKPSISTPIRAKLEERDDDLSSIIEICTENDSDQDLDEVSSNSNTSNNKIPPPLSSATSSSIQTNPNVSFRSNAVQLLDIPEICRQLQELRKSHDVLRRELELTRIENEEYKMRLERLECKIDEQELRLS